MKYKMLLISIATVFVVAVSIFLINDGKPDVKDKQLTLTDTPDIDTVIQHNDDINKLPSQSNQQLDIQCKDVTVKSKELEASIQQRDFLISKSVRAANELNAPFEIREYIAQKMGIPILTFREITQYGPENDIGDPQSYSTLAELDPSIQKDKLKGDDFTHFLRLMQSGDYNEIIAMADRRPFNRGTTFGGRPIISALLYHDAKVPVQVIEDLAKMGLVPSIYDLQTATQNKSPMATIVALRSHTESDVTTQWRELNTQGSLSMVAATSMYAEAFEYWLGQSSPVQFEELDINAADLIATSINDVSTDTAEHFLQTLFSEGLVPFDQTNRALLVSYVSTHSLDYMTDYITLLLTHKLSIDGVELPAEMEISLQQTAEEIMSLNAVVAEKQRYIANCSEIAVTASLQDEPKPSSDLDQANLALALEIDLLAKQQDWPGYIDKWKSLSNQTGNNDVMQFAIGELIRNHAPHDYIIELIEQGYDMPELTIFAIITADDTILANKLLRYDLQVSNVFLESMNPKEFAIKMGASDVMLQFIDNHSN